MQPRPGTGRCVLRTTKEAIANKRRTVHTYLLRSRLWSNVWTATVVGIDSWEAREGEYPAVVQAAHRSSRLLAIVREHGRIAGPGSRKTARGHGQGQAYGLGGLVQRILPHGHFKRPVHGLART
jgi:hypothetical protein